MFFAVNSINTLSSASNTSALNVHGFSVSELQSLRSDPGGGNNIYAHAAWALSVRDAIVVAMYIVVVE